MSTIPLGLDLKTLFDDVTSGRQPSEGYRAILVQNDNGTLKLVDTLPENSSDKEDFSSALGKLFAKEPSKSGYALYRLDSKSSAGLFEWLNCAYRPEGAKVREKMQYAITQTSLFQGLNEQHFLETVYGGTVSEFSFPTRLRNQRKHDYQNPQQSTAGKKAAEAAGTGTAGRRNFEKIPSPGALPQRPSSIRKDTPPSQVEDDDIPEVKQTFPAQDIVVPSEDTRPPTPPEMVGNANPPPPPPVMSEKEKERREKGEMELAQGIANGEGVDVDAREEILSKETENSQPKAAIDTHEEQSQPLLEDSQSLMEKDEIVEELPAAIRKEATKREVLEEQVSPSNPTKVFAPIFSGSSSQDNIKSTSTSIGTGTGSGSLETERERHLANLKTEEQKVKSSGSQGGSHVGFSWQEDVEPALRGLAKKLGGTPEWNLVVLKIDLSKEEIELASQPRFLLPGDLAETLPDSEPCYAFYSHPDTQKDTDDSSQVAIIYSCPLHSSVRQRMLYSANLATTSTRVSEIQGLDILKRIETSDPKELTAAFFAEELLGALPTQGGQAKALSRPKRPGRK